MRQLLFFHYRQQVANFKLHIAEATRWLLGCEAQVRPWVFVNRLLASDADTLVWRVDLAKVKLALGIEACPRAMQLAKLPQLWQISRIFTATLQLTILSFGGTI